ncbi:MAG: glycoside hydrolase family 3 protein [Butyrivibrio sp.]|nr:glycoside hydrolase family 3 protein [Butyrivibrio sp.]
MVNTGDSSEDTTYFESDYGELSSDNLTKLIADTYDEAVQEEAEGAVLLKNDNSALPLADTEKKITLFGHAVAQPLYKNASAGSKGYNSSEGIDLYTALKNQGFEINDTLFDAYKNSSTERGTGAFDFVSQTTSVHSMGEEDISFYTDELKASFENYSDVAVVMFAREGGEGMELAIEDEFEGISQLALHQEEKDLLNMIKDSGVFKKVVVLINSGNPMELEWLDEYGVDACLWIGEPGQRGFEAVARILDGTVNPSGSLTDTYAASSISAPAVVNGSFNNQTWANLDEVLAAIDDDDAGISYSTVQAEGIYVGYKYYETRYEDSVLGQGNATSKAGSSFGNEWNYAAEVTYPFGYGLSYTTFEKKLDDVSIEGDDITVNVTVTNTGSVAGKTSVQIYAQTPYGDYEKKNLVEKSAIQLLDFGKSELLQPGESQTITITCDKYLLASYDYTNVKGYIMSEGTYYLAVGDNAHDALNNVLAAKGAEVLFDQDGESVSGNADNVYSWNEKLDTETYKVSRYSDETVTNRFDEANPNYWQDDTVTYLSRNDWEKTYPTEATKLTLSEDMIKLLAGNYYEKSEDALSVSAFIQGANTGTPLAAMIGLDYDDQAWEEYLNQFTIDELTGLLSDNFGTTEITSVGKPAVVAGDGPDGVGGTYNESKYGTGVQDTCFPTEIVLASTFNKDLMYNRGKLMANECMYLGMEEDWMPGVNIHRTPFGGRNFEYYSEDGVMNYLCEIPEVTAMEERGVHAGAKHVVGNDQENNREGIAVFFNEQAFREITLRAAEGAVAVAKGQALMHGFNRLGLVWCSENSALCNQVIEKEWGFVGQQETDAVAGSAGTYKWHLSSAVAAGVDQFCLDFAGDVGREVAAQIKETDDGDLLALVRKSAHDYLYTVANSSIMNGYSVDSKIVSVTPWWQPLMKALIVLFAALDVFFICMNVRTRKAKIVEE